MKGKLGLVIGLAAGYVLGSRAGRERYEQIKDQALKVWNAEPVQQQVGKVEDFAKSAVATLPSTLWDGAQKITKAATKKDKTPGQRLDAAIKESKESADHLRSAAETSADSASAEVKDATSSSGV